MKIRTGFVSNSSSSSFCVWGTYIPLEKFLTENDNKNHVAPEIYESIMEKIYDGIIFPYPLKSAVLKSSNYAIVGLPYAELRDEETGAQFKKRSENLIISCLSDIKDIEFKFINREVYS